MDLYIYFFFLCIQYQNHFFLSYHKYRRLYNPSIIYNIRGGSKTAATFKVELFVIIVNGWKSLTIITKSSTLDVAAVLDPPLNIRHPCIAIWKNFDNSSSKHKNILRCFYIG